MRRFATLIAVLACWAPSGCAPRLFGPVDLGQQYSPSNRWVAAPNAPAQRSVRARQRAVARNAPVRELNEEAQASADASGATRGASGATLAGFAEEIATPRSNALDSVTKADDISDPDGLTRRVADVPLDISPPEGDLPPDLAAQAFRDERPVVEPRTETVVAWTPWTICFRPLYFEEIGLERYGCSAGAAQSSISAARFFFGVGLLPYKTISRLPRSCVCSNGFSRCGDAPPPGYEDCSFHIDGAAFEAATLAAIVLSLP